MNGAISEPFELEFDPACLQLKQDEIDKLTSIGVKLVCRQAGEMTEDQWWERGHNVDASDAHVY